MSPAASADSHVAEGLAGCQVSGSCTGRPLAGSCCTNRRDGDSLECVMTAAPADTQYNHVSCQEWSTGHSTSPMWCHCNALLLQSLPHHPRPHHHKLQDLSSCTQDSRQPHPTCCCCTVGLQALHTCCCCCCLPWCISHSGSAPGLHHRQSNGVTPGRDLAANHLPGLQQQACTSSKQAAALTLLIMLCSTARQQQQQQQSSCLHLTVPVSRLNTSHLQLSHPSRMPH